MTVSCVCVKECQYTVSRERPVTHVKHVALHIFTSAYDKIHPCQHGAGLMVFKFKVIDVLLDVLDNDTCECTYSAKQRKQVRRSKTK